MAASTIHAVRQALISGLSALPALSSLTISYGPPIPVPHRYLWIGDANSDQGSAALGKRRRDERYTIECRCSVVRQGNDGDGTATEAYGYVHAVEDLLRDNPTLSGLYAGDGQIIHAEFVTVTNDEPLGDDKGREHLVTFNIGIHARI